MSIPAASGLVIVSLDLRRWPLPCGQRLPLALRLGARALSVGSFFPSCWPAADMVVLLCDGWASASRRSYTHSSLRVVSAEDHQSNRSLWTLCPVLLPDRWDWGIP